MRFSAFSDAVPGSSSAEIADVQGKLVQLGYVLDVNGSYGAETSAAVLDFRAKMELPIADKIDGALITGLEMAGRPAYSARFRHGAPPISLPVKVGIGLALIGAVYLMRG